MSELSTRSRHHHQQHQTRQTRQQPPESFLKYSSGKTPPIVVVVGDGRSRVRRVVRTATRHVTVVSYSTRHKETRTHTSHHVTTISFPQQKSIERSGSGQYVLPAPGSITSSASSGGLGNYVYLQQQQQQQPQQQNHHVSTPQTTQQLIYQQQQQLCHQPVSHHHYHPHHHHPHQQQQLLHHGHHHGGAVVVAGSGVGTGIGISSLQNIVHKKNSVRSNGDVLKRSRAQTAYELSQDLLEKQIELLERKYGGLRARNAAITIQRAFRHYMMVKKFASITAMAKAEKRLSRRMMTITGATTTVTTTITPSTLDNIENSPSLNSSSSAYGSTIDTLIDNIGSPLQQSQQRVCATITAQTSSSGGRIPPTRSVSLRERRPLDSSPIPRSQSGNTSPMPPITNISCWPQQTTGTIVTTSHPHVNLLHASEQHYYSTPIGIQGQGQFNSNQQYQNVQNIGNSDGSFSSINSPHMDSSFNISWNTHNSPHSPYYTAAQIYMRPRGTTPTNCSKRIPPEVPKRTSSITAQQQQQLLRQTPPPPPSMIDITSTRHIRSNGLCKTSENGSLTSVQSSGSDSSVTSAERIINCDLSSDRSNSPNTWKRNGGNNLLNTTNSNFIQSPDHMIVLSTSHQNSLQPNVVSDECMSSHTSAAQYEQHEHNEQLVAVTTTPQNYKVSETIRKRQYRVGLNLFNKKPEKGITYLIRRGFLENSPHGVARFLISRKGLSRQMIGEYLGNLQSPFNMAVLECFSNELDLSGMQVDVALRKFQAYFRMPGEAQKIERLMEVFSQRYCQCNTDIVARLRSSDTVFVLAFAIIMLNTDLHTPNLKPERRMRIDDFIKNLRGIDDCHDIDRDMLAGIYERVKANEFKPGSDHVTQVMKVQATIVGKKLNLALPHRRLVCYCRLYEIPDVNKKERPGVHQREVFLFNDLLVITKIFSKKKSSVTYTFRNSYPLCGMVLTLLDVTNYPYCIRLSQKVDGKILVTFNARNEHDRCKFAEDLRESISEMDEMESLRIEAELERQKSARVCSNRTGGSSENRDSGVADVEVCPCPFQNQQNGDNIINGHETAAQLKRSALSNSLLDMHEQFGNEKPQRRGSVGSLDSGMSISFQSTSASTASRENAAAIANAVAVSKARYLNNNAFNTSAQFPINSIQTQGNINSSPLFSIAAIPLQMNCITSTTTNGGNNIIGTRSQRDRKSSKTDENGRSTEV